MRTSGFYPIFSQVTCDLKEKMGKNGGNAHVLASYIFGVIWSKSPNGVFSCNKSEMETEICVSRETIRKYLAILVGLDYLIEINDGEAYQINKSLKYSFTIHAEKPEPIEAMNTANMLGNPPTAKHVGTVPTCLAENANMLGDSDTIVLDSSNSNIIVPSIPDQFKEIWTLLGLSVRAKSLWNTIDKYSDDGQALVDICSAWLDWGLSYPDEFAKIDKPLLVWRIQNGIYPDKSTSQKRWFDDAPENYFEDVGI